MNDMNTYADPQDRIDAYVLDRMSTEEKENFEAEMHADEALRRQCAFTLRVKEALTERRRMEEKMGQWQQEMAEEEQKRLQASAAARGLRIRRAAWIAGIAAVLIVGILLFPAPAPGTLSAGNAILDDESVRGGSDLSQVEMMIQDRQYQHALETICNEERIVGIELRKRDGAEEATEDEELRGQMAYELQELQLRLQDLRWLKVYALDGLGRRQEAATLAQEISEEAGIYSERADSILRFLK